MNRLQAIIIALGLACHSTGTATAADEAMLLDAPEISIEGAQARSGWYLRGDIGYSAWRSVGSPSFTDAVGTATSFDDTRFGKLVSGSVGAGYRINDIFRADLTGEFFTGEMDGAFTGSQPCAASPIGTSCAYDGSADVRAYGLMLNGYVDIANVAGFTPYVGAGLGATRVSWSDFTADTGCIGAACGAGAGGSSSFQGESSWRFSYALMAGVTYEISDRMKLDLGYRYSDIADGPMLRAGEGEADDDGFRRHEVRLGLQVGF